MESNFCNTGLSISGNMSADATLLITDLFDLFPSSFSKLIPLLETRYRIVSYSDTGFDRFNRTKNLRHETMHGYANELIALLREDGIQNVTCIAHSVNAMLAFYAAVKDPQLFDKIVLLSAVPYLNSDLVSQFYQTFSATADDNLLFDQIVETQTGIDVYPEQLPALLSTSFSRMNPDKAKLIFHLLMTTDARFCLDKLTVPVMILQGLTDKIATAETAFFMHRRVPDSCIIKIRSKGHLPQLSAPEEVFQAMEIFMYPVVC